MNRQFLLIDNGSRKPDATLNLRRLANELSARTGESVLPVSLQHSNKIDPIKLDNHPAVVLDGFLNGLEPESPIRINLIPLFFGESRALTSFVPEVFARFPGFEYRLADTLYPLPEGDDRIAEILIDHANDATETDTVILVDHGSPLPAVTAVRNALFDKLKGALPDNIDLREAVMERREGREYDFNGALLEDLLEQLGQSGEPHHVRLVMLFISPGRHAGVGGDIETICQVARAKHSNLNIEISPLVADHPKLIDVLADRTESLSALK